MADANVTAAQMRCSYTNCKCSKQRLWTPTRYATEDTVYTDRRKYYHDGGSDRKPSAGHHRLSPHFEHVRRYLCRTSGATDDLVVVEVELRCTVVPLRSPPLVDGHLDEVAVVRMSYRMASDRGQYQWWVATVAGQVLKSLLAKSWSFERRLV